MSIGHTTLYILSVIDRDIVDGLERPSIPRIESEHIKGCLCLQRSTPPVARQLFITIHKVHLRSRNCALIRAVRAVLEAQIPKSYRFYVFMTLSSFLLRTL